MANQISIIGNVFKLEKTGEPTKYFNKTDVSIKFRGSEVQIGSEYLEEVVDYPIATFSGSTDGTNFTSYTTEETIAGFFGTALASVSEGEVDTIKDNIQGYLGLLSGVYFGDATGTSIDIPIEQVDIWQDVVMTIQAPVSGVHAGGISDQRIQAMRTAQPTGYAGDGTAGNPLVFLLEGLKESSSCNLRTSLTFEPDEDGGRLDSRLFLERHSAAQPSEDFPINAAGLAMESGADEVYPHLVNIQFFVGDTINTNGVGDAGKVRFQVKSDVAGTISMNEMALFIQY